jgi:hypothetical protein
MGNPIAGQRARYSDDVSGKEDKKAICSDRRGRRQQVRQQLLRLAGSLCAALTLHAEPIQFNHQRHAALKLKCVYCHATAETAERATFPSASKCEACHTTMALPKDAKVIPAKPVYTLPDFVFFSHAKHAAANIACETCHGDVWQQTAIKPVLLMKMAACVECHKARKATIVCNQCHELSQ